MVDAGQNPNVLNCFTGKNSPKHKTPKYEQNHNKNGINNDQKNIVHSNSYQKNVETSPIHEKIPEIIIGKVAKLENDESSNSSSSTSSSTNSAKSVDSITSSFSSLSSSSSSSKHSKGKNLAMVQEETGIDPEGIEETEHQNQGNKIAKYIENIFIKLFEELAKLTKQINYSHGNRKYNLKKEELKNFIKNIYSNIDQAKNPSEMLYKSNKLMLKNVEIMLEEEKIPKVFDKYFKINKSELNITSLRQIILAILGRFKLKIFSQGCVSGFEEINKNIKKLEQLIQEHSELKEYSNIASEALQLTQLFNELIIGVTNFSNSVELKEALEKEGIKNEEVNKFYQVYKIGKEFDKKITNIFEKKLFWGDLRFNLDIISVIYKRFAGFYELKIFLKYDEGIN